MLTQYFCGTRRRVAALREAAGGSPAMLLNGIEYLEVEAGQTRLAVHFVFPLGLVPGMPLTERNVEVRGGVRVRDPRVEHVEVQGDVLMVDLDRAGDFSRYVLRLVTSPAENSPPPGIDLALAEVEFSFKVDCPSEFDCRTELECAPERPAEPPLDYLARDYQSFRRLMLDRLSTMLPDWRERSPADLWVALVELIAFRADELSYFQDAVAAETYLGTARRRISVRRHVRPLDYPFHDGRNARAWVAFAVEPAADGQVLPGCDPLTGLGGTLLLTRVAGVSLAPRVELPQAQLALDAGAEAFETLHPITLRQAHNLIEFYTWSDEECCLPRGATRAFLRDPAKRLQLLAGHVLIFEERKSPITGLKEEADGGHRHAVRLTSAESKTDPLTGEPVVDIRWDPADALPFALCLSTRIGSQLVEQVSMALGNVVLADHGRTVPDVGAAGEELAVVPEDVVFRPLLQRGRTAPLTQQAYVRRRDSEAPTLVDVGAPASSALVVEMHDVRPAVDLRDVSGRRWTVRSDLLASGPFDTEFVVETEDDGRAYLRFGNGVNGRRPIPRARYAARYRIGNGRAGNMGAEAIAHVVTGGGGFTNVRNPMAAGGGTDPHPIAQAKLYAPQAFRRQERAVTPGDYASVIERHAEVQRAVATRRWTGSWHTLFITVDRREGAPVDAPFERDLRRFLERFRLAGHDVEIDPPRFVPLDVAIDVCVRPGYFPADVKERLLRAFSRREMPDGGRGFFHPDDLTFGGSVYLSAIVARAMQVPGVSHVTVRRFQRLGRASVNELQEGVIRAGRLEIPRLDNDPNAPENGRLELRILDAA